MMLTQLRFLVWSLVGRRCSVTCACWLYTEFAVANRNVLSMLLL